LRLRDLPLQLPIVLIADKKHLGAVLYLIAELVEPVLSISERLFVGDVEDNQNAVNVAVADGGDGAVAFGSSCVP